MSRVPPWFERQFDFAFPVDHYFSLCVRLRGTPARLAEMIGSASRDAVVGKPGEHWSAQEHAGHLLDLESLWMARVDDFLSGDDRLTVADLTNRKTHEANHNARLSIEIVKEFRTARLRLVDRLERLQPADFGRTALHPRLKQAIRLVDHLYFVAEHDDHHLATIWELTSRSRQPARQ